MGGRAAALVSVQVAHGNAYTTVGFGMATEAISSKTIRRLPWARARESIAWSCSAEGIR